MWIDLRNRERVITLLGLYYGTSNSQRNKHGDKLQINRVTIIGDVIFPNVDWISLNGLVGTEFVTCA